MSTRSHLPPFIVTETGSEEESEGYPRGASTVLTTALSMSSTVWPVMAISGESWTRWRRTGRTARFTSPGVM
jgi:hypothetical protein